MSDGIRDSSDGLFRERDETKEADASGTELTRLLDRFKRHCQMAGQTHQRALFGTTDKDDTKTWMDEAEATRSAIIEHVKQLTRKAHDAGMRNAD